MLKQWLKKQKRTILQTLVQLLQSDSPITIYINFLEHLLQSSDLITGYIGGDVCQRRLLQLLHTTIFKECNRLWRKDNAGP